MLYAVPCRHCCYSETILDKILEEVVARVGFPDVHVFNLIINAQFYCTKLVGEKVCVTLPELEDSRERPLAELEVCGKMDNQQ